MVNCREWRGKGYFVVDEALLEISLREGRFEGLAEVGGGI